MALCVHRDTLRYSSLQKGVTARSDVLRRSAEAGGFRPRVFFVTLTYRAVDGWAAGHISEFWHRARAWAGRLGFKLRYVWVAELQQRGAVHYHAVVWLPKGVSMPKPDKQGWWPHGMSERKAARSPVGYLVNYCKALKNASAERAFPKGVRLHGAAGLGAELRAVARWRCAPGWVRALTGAVCDVARARGGWLVRATGELLASPWVLVDHGPKFSYLVFAPKGATCTTS